MRGTVLLLGAGSGSRLGTGAATPKAFVRLEGTSLLRRAADAAAAAGLVDAVVAAVPAGFEDAARLELEGLRVAAAVVAGGLSRVDSCAAALDAAGGALAVAVHDAARPLCPPRLFDEALAALDDAQASCVAVPVADTVKVVRDGVVLRTPDRSELAAAQTPQAFHAGVLRAAHDAARAGGWASAVTDDAAMAERCGVRVAVVGGDPANLKITGPLDLDVARALLRRAAGAA